MQKLLIGVLALLVLFFAAANARLARRQRVLEDKVAALEPQRRTKPPATALAPEPVVAAPIPTPAEPVAAAPAAPAPAVPSLAPASFLDQAQTYLNRATDDLRHGLTAQ